uniref:Uncharacterized protein n=1 Tax=Podarcis muralis TaxID=64176 RepID=A0A670IKN4_PODMU
CHPRIHSPHPPGPGRREFLCGHKAAVVALVWHPLEDKWVSGAEDGSIRTKQCIYYDGAYWSHLPNLYLSASCSESQLHHYQKIVPMLYSCCLNRVLYCTSSPPTNKLVLNGEGELYPFLF